MKEVLPHLLEQQVTVFILADTCETAGVESFKDKMNEASSEPLPKTLRSHLTLQSPAVYIYTSGTTGKLLQVLRFTILWYKKDLIHYFGLWLFFNRSS